MKCATLLAANTASTRLTKSTRVGLIDAQSRATKKKFPFKFCILILKLWKQSHLTEGQLKTHVGSKQTRKYDDDADRDKDTIKNPRIKALAYGDRRRRRKFIQSYITRASMLLRKILIFSRKKERKGFFRFLYQSEKTRWREVAHDQDFSNNEKVSLTRLLALFLRMFWVRRSFWLFTILLRLFAYILLKEKKNRKV